ncbi:hypothetical protein [Thiomicrorhabdus aquaedulcis]|uniref:hypothetical protein n=1 Tax=Thiomicrorhabdus aquaedulcis TaxID=2211106 RepID=UPI000FDA5B09|nr:hypothetical protein [Thiomicrorhabdus aquaedulcis]
MRISRLVELEQTQHTPAFIQQALLDETKLAVKYIYSQNLLPFNSPIGLVFLEGQAEVLVDLQSACQKEGLLRTTWEAHEYTFAISTFTDLVPNGVFCKPALGESSECCFSQQAVVDYVFSQPPKGFYFNDYVLKISGLLQARKVIIGLNALLLLGAVYYILTNSVDALMSVHKQNLINQYISDHEAEKTYLQDKVKLQDDAQEIKASVEFSEAILKLNVNGLLGFDAYDLSQVLSKHPNIQLSTLEWKTLGQFDSQRNQLVLQGWVFPFYDTYLLPVTWVDNFVADLTQLTGIEVVELQKEPLNRELSQALVIDAKVGEVKALPFVVTLRVKDAQSN